MKHLNNNLFQQITSFSNLLSAFLSARRTKRGKPNVASFEVNLEREILRIKTELDSGIYQPGPYKAFQIYDPKERTISAAPFRDRVAHHALCNIIEPIFEKTFIFDTYANRREKGTHQGIRRCQRYLRGYRFVLKADTGAHVRRKSVPAVSRQGNSPEQTSGVPGLAGTDFRRT